MSSERSENEAPKSGIVVGCQGWNYPDWVSRPGGDTVFYPRGTKPGEMLALYAEIFGTVEVDSTFYAIPPASTVDGWYRKTPERFTFSLKMPQEITHTHELRELSYVVLEAFCERVRGLREKLAAVLIQLPPSFEGTRENALTLRAFLERLPADIRFAVEFRHRDWMIDWTYKELAERGVALCLCEGRWIPREMMFAAARETGAGFSYVRFMGERDLERFDRLYRREDAVLGIWSEQIEGLGTADTYVYFSNFFEGNAPASANRLKELLGLGPVHPSVLINQGSLF